MNIQGHEFHVEKHPDVLIAHGYLGDRNSGQIWIVVVEGTDEANLRAELEEHLEGITEMAKDMDGEPDFVYLGHDPESKPENGDVANWPTA